MCSLSAANMSKMSHFVITIFSSKPIHKGKNVLKCRRNKGPRVLSILGYNFDVELESYKLFLGLYYFLNTLFSGATKS